MTAADVIERLRLQPHPVEGGYFRETHRHPDLVLTSAGPRSIGTAIYYLLSASAVSEMHILPGPEIYHYYCGDPLETVLLHPDGKHEIHSVGPNIAVGQVAQLVIPGGVWQGSVRRSGSAGFTLIGATMAPGFDYTDYTTGRRADLIHHWPAAAEYIIARTPRDNIVSE